MRKISILLCSFLFATLISMLTISPAQANIDQFTWLPPYVKVGYDSFYGTNIVGYKTGETASLVVHVNNNLGATMNVSSVIISFDWDQNVTLNSTASPVQIKNGQTRVFTVTFDVPSTNTASNMWAHTYKIHVEHVNGTGYPLTPWTENWNSWVGPGYKFVVFSGTQADALELSQIISRIASNDPFKDLTFNSTEAKLAVYKAQNETSNGDALYQRGDFVEAKAHYNVALILYNVAYSAEETLGPTLDDLFIREIESRISNWEASASLAASFSTTSILLGSAVVLFGIGYVIKQLGTLRKPETEPVKK
jgi:hypothetical protein